MSDMFTRLGRLARSVISDFTREPDADFNEAWEELDRFLDRDDQDPASRPHGTDSAHGRYGSQGARGSQAGAAASLARDYANLELSPACSDEEIRLSYKRLLRAYHPDRFAESPEKQAIATEVTTRLNESYRRIMAARQPGKA